LDEIRLQVVNVLQAHRKPQQAVADAALGAAFRA